MSLALKVIVSEGGQKIAERLVDPEKKLTIGRDSNCGICLPNRSISRKHLTLLVDSKGQAELRNIGILPISMKGEVHESLKLLSNELLSFGPYQIQVIFPNSKTVDHLSVLDNKTDLIFDAQEEGIEKNEQILNPPAFDSPNKPELESPIEGQLLDSGLEEKPVEDNFSVPDPVSPSAVDHGEAQLLSSSQDEVTGSVEEDEFEIRLNSTISGEIPKQFSKSEISIGRSPDNDLVIMDDNASKKHAKIIRSGIRVQLVDLGSSNGTFINGQKIDESEIQSDDKIRFGDSEFVFDLVHRGFDYQPAIIPENEDLLENTGSSLDLDAQSESQLAVDQASVPLTTVSMPNIQGAPVLGSTEPLIAGNPKKGLIAQFRSMDPKRRRLYLILLAVAAAGASGFLGEQEPDPALSKPKVAQKAVQSRSFEAQNPDIQKFIENQHTVALELFKAKEFSRSLFEIRRVFQYVDDYRASREIERNAEEAMRRIDAAEREKREQEEKSALLAQLNEHLENAKKLMEKNEYPSAQKLFPEILALDPENIQVPQWQRSIESFYEAQKIREEQLRVEEGHDAAALKQLELAESAHKEGLRFRAMELFSQVPKSETKRKDLLEKATNSIQNIIKEISDLRAPKMNAAVAAENSGNIVEAFRLYQEVTQLDPYHEPAYDGMDRIRGALDQRAKHLYIDAILAESYGEYRKAKQQFQQIVDTAPPESNYSKKALSKLKKYSLLEDRSPASVDNFSETIKRNDGND